jgi:hypothetical protein
VHEGGRKVSRDFIVYTAGPIAGTTYGESTDWREYVRERLAELDPKIRAASPMRGKEYLASIQAMPSSNFHLANLGTKHPMSTPQAILARDRMDVMRADLLLVNFLGATKVSIGTCCEVAWADLLRTPVMLLMEDEGNVHDHPFITGNAGWRLNNIEQAIELIPMILIPDFARRDASVDASSVN